MTVVHQSLIRRHGYLSPFTCLIDQRFTLKIAEFGLYDLIKDVATPEMSNKLSANATITYANVAQWIAPELHADYKTSQMKNIRSLAATAGPEADVFSIGGLIDIVMEENLALEDTEQPPRYSLSGIRTIVEACQNSQTWRRPLVEEVSIALAFVSERNKINLIISVNILIGEKTVCFEDRNEVRRVFGKLGQKDGNVC